MVSNLGTRTWVFITRVDLSLFRPLVGLGQLGNWRKGETLNVPTRQGANNLMLLPSITWYKELYKKRSKQGHMHTDTSPAKSWYHARHWTVNANIVL